MTNEEWKKQLAIYNSLTKKEQRWINPNATYDRIKDDMLLYYNINDKGFICAYYYDHNKSWVGFEIAIKKEYRNQHLAHKWIRDMIVYLLQRGLTKIMTCVNDYNLPSKHLIRDVFKFNKYNYNGHLGYYYRDFSESDFIENRTLSIHTTNSTDISNNK